MTSTYPLQNGSSTPILGRGILRCHPERRLELAAAAVLAQRPFVPSIAQAVQDFHVSRRELVERIELYRALEGNGNGHAVVKDHTVPGIEQAGNGVADKSPETVRCGYARFLIEELLAATPEERVEVARGLGIDWVWDCLIMPCMRSNNNG
jgi:hypothetical protein